MALRYVSRKVGVPALRRALEPRVSPSVGSGRLASRSSQIFPRQQTTSSISAFKAGYSNGEAQKMKGSRGVVEEKNASGSDEVARIKAAYQGTIDAIERMRRMEKLQRRLDLGSALVGVGLGTYIVSCIPREAIEKAMRK